MTPRTCLQQGHADEISTVEVSMLSKYLVDGVCFERQLISNHDHEMEIVRGSNNKNDDTTTSTQTIPQCGFAVVDGQHIQQIRKLRRLQMPTKTGFSQQKRSKNNKAFSRKTTTNPNLCTTVKTAGFGIVNKHKMQKRKMRIERTGTSSRTDTTKDICNDDNSMEDSASSNLLSNLFSPAVTQESTADLSVQFLADLSSTELSLKVTSRMQHSASNILLSHLISPAVSIEMKDNLGRQLLLDRSSTALSPNVDDRMQHSASNDILSRLMSPTISPERKGNPTMQSVGGQSPTELISKDEAAILTHEYQLKVCLQTPIAPRYNDNNLQLLRRRMSNESYINTGNDVQHDVSTISKDNLPRSNLAIQPLETPMTKSKDTVKSAADKQGNRKQLDTNGARLSEYVTSYGQKMCVTSPGMSSCDSSCQTPLSAHYKRKKISVMMRRLSNESKFQSPLNATKSTQGIVTLSKEGNHSESRNVESTSNQKFETMSTSKKCSKKITDQKVMSAEVTSASSFIRRGKVQTNTKCKTKTGDATNEKKAAKQIVQNVEKNGLFDDDDDCNDGDEESIKVIKKGTQRKDSAIKKVCRTPSPKKVSRLEYSASIAPKETSIQKPTKLYRTPSPKKDSRLGSSSSLAPKESSMRSMLADSPGDELRMPVRQVSNVSTTSSRDTDRTSNCSSKEVTDDAETSFPFTTPRRRESISPMKTPTSVQRILSSALLELSQCHLDNSALDLFDENMTSFSPLPSQRKYQSNQKRAKSWDGSETSPQKRSTSMGSSKLVADHDTFNDDTVTPIAPRRYLSATSTPFQSKRNSMSYSKLISHATAGASSSNALQFNMSISGIGQHNLVTPKKEKVQQVFRSWSQQQKGLEHDDHSTDNADESIQALLLLHSKSTSGASSLFRVNSHDSMLPRKTRNSGYPTKNKSFEMPIASILKLDDEDAVPRRPSTIKKGVKFPLSIRLASQYYDPVLVPVVSDDDQNNIVLKSDLYWSSTELQVFQRLAIRNAKKFISNNTKFVQRFEKLLNRLGDTDSTSDEELLRSTSSMSCSSLEFNDDEILRKWVEHPSVVRGLEGLVASDFYRAAKRHEIVASVVGYYNDMKKKDKTRTSNDTPSSSKQESRRQQQQQFQQQQQKQKQQQRGESINWSDNVDTEFLRQHCRRMGQKSTIIARLLAVEDAAAVGIAVEES